MQPFYLSKNEHGYFKVRYPDPVTGVLGTAKSTHTKNRMKAANIAAEWLKNGIPSGTSCERLFEQKEPEIDLEKLVARLTLSDAQKLTSLINAKFKLAPLSVPVMEPVSVKESTPVISESLSNVSETVVSEAVSFVQRKPVAPTPIPQNDKSKPVLLLESLLHFWDYENSTYVKKRIARGYDIKQRNCKEKLGIVKRYWATYFTPDRTVQSLTSKELDDFLLYLRMEKGLSADTVNKTMTAGNMAFEFLIKEGAITSNPLSGVERFKVTSRKRGIPTETEMKQLMNLDWDWTDRANKLAFKVAAMFGLRAGEISGLQVCDIDVTADLR